jgi:hypothetical protein
MVRIPVIMARNQHVTAFSILVQVWMRIPNYIIENYFIIYDSVKIIVISYICYDHPLQKEGESTAVGSVPEN